MGNLSKAHDHIKIVKDILKGERLKLVEAAAVHLAIAFIHTQIELAGGLRDLVKKMKP